MITCWRCGVDFDPTGFPYGAPCGDCEERFNLWDGEAVREQKLRQIQEFTRAGWSASRIGRRLGIHGDTVQKYRKMSDEDTPFIAPITLNQRGVRRPETIPVRRFAPVAVPKVQVDALDRHTHARRYSDRDLWYVYQISRRWSNYRMQKELGIHHSTVKLAIASVEGGHITDPHLEEEDAGTPTAVSVPAG